MAAWVMALYMHSLGHAALHLEASDLLNYSAAILRQQQFTGLCLAIRGQRRSQAAY